MTIFNPDGTACLINTLERANKPTDSSFFWPLVFCLPTNPMGKNNEKNNLFAR